VPYCGRTMHSLLRGCLPDGLCDSTLALFRREMLELLNDDFHVMRKTLRLAPAPAPCLRSYSHSPFPAGSRTGSRCPWSPSPGAAGPGNSEPPTATLESGRPSRAQNSGVPDNGDDQNVDKTIHGDHSLRARVPPRGLAQKLQNRLVANRWSFLSGPFERKVY
jgi:hypothetical protein